MSQTSITALERAGVKRKFLEDYRHITGDGLVDKIRLLVAQFKGTRLLHVNANRFRGVKWPNCRTYWCPRSRTEGGNNRW